MQVLWNPPISFEMKSNVVIISAVEEYGGDMQKPLLESKTVNTRFCNK
jgi:hypothetical protein